MDIPPPETIRTKIAIGSSPSPQIQHLAASYPFTQQVDIVFPSSDILEDVLSGLDTQFMRGKFALSDVYERFSNLSSDSTTLYLTTGEADDKWCIDCRGVITLCVSKDTYQRLGLVGNKLPFKGCEEQYVVRIPLHDKSESVGMKAKRKKALQDWDRRRQEGGLGKWDVMFYHPSISASYRANGGEEQKYEVKPCIRKSSLIHIPIPSSAWTSRPTNPASEEKQEWDERINSIFEWVGMACLGAQRLEVNDRVDPYVAVYSPPDPSRMGTVTHLRWRGFLTSTFVQSVIDTVLSSLSATLDTDPPSSFVSITAHTFSTSPVIYIPPGAGPGETGKDSPLRVPRGDSEHCLSLILVPGCSKKDDRDRMEDNGSGAWVMAESTGKWDMRWG